MDEKFQPGRRFGKLSIFSQKDLDCKLSESFFFFGEKL